MNFSVARILSFVLILIVQGVFFKNIVLFHTAFCFVYVLYLLTLPVETNSLALMIIAFALGCGVDVFYDSLGLHATASVCLAYLRNYWLQRITPQGGYGRNSLPTLAAQGLQWFMVYALPLIFIHHALLFFVEAGGMLYFWFTLLKTITSTLFTITVLVIGQMIFSR